MEGGDKGRDQERIIKNLLRSEKLADRQQGFEKLIECYGRPLLGWIKKIAIRSVPEPTLTDFLREDIKLDIWQETFKSVWQNVVSKKFRYEGSLFSYLITIAHRRTVEWKRRRLKDRHRADFDPKSMAFTLPGCRKIELLELIEEFCKSLTGKQRDLAEMYLKLLELEFKHVPARVLAHELNATHPEVTFSVDWVKKKRKRIRSMLRIFLRKRGYDV